MLTRSAPNWRFFVAGYACGVGVYLLVRALEALLLRDRCAGHTIFALIAPLLLGPGGLALALTNWERPAWSAFGFGLAAASLFPALFLGARALEGLKLLGCAPALPLPGAPPPLP